MDWMLISMLTLALLVNLFISLKSNKKVFLNDPKNLLYSIGIWAMVVIPSIITRLNLSPENENALLAFYVIISVGVMQQVVVYQLTAEKYQSGYENYESLVHDLPMKLAQLDWEILFETPPQSREIARNNFHVRITNYLGFKLLTPKTKGDYISLIKSKMNVKFSPEDSQNTPDSSENKVLSQKISE